MKYDFCLVRGEPLYLRIKPIDEINKKEINLKNYNAKMQIRFEVGKQPVIEADTLIRDNYIYISLDKNKSLTLPLKEEPIYSGEYKKLKYDLLIYNECDLKIVLSGNIKIIPTITEVGK